MEKFAPVCYKVASASLTDLPLLRHLQATGRPLILSSGLSTMDEVRRGAALIPAGQLLLAHSTSSYPAKPEELNLRMIGTLQSEFDCPVEITWLMSKGTNGTAVALGSVLDASGATSTFGRTESPVSGTVSDDDGVRSSSVPLLPLPPSSLEEQAETTLHIGRNIETISRVTHEAASGNQTIASAVQEMSALIEDLQTRVARFRLGGESEQIVVEKAEEAMLIPLKLTPMGV
jgi:hypothetical protein